MPTLTVIAGPNGAGKTKFSEYFIENGFINTKPFDTDAISKQVDDSKISADFLRVEAQRNKQVKEILLQEAKKAIQTNTDFCFESNISSKIQLSPIELFDKAGYNINLIYIFLHSIEKSKERVDTRKREGGHRVEEAKLRANFDNGLIILNNSFNDWDRVFLIDNNTDISRQKQNPKVLLISEKGKMIRYFNLPSKEVRSKIPKIMDSINDYLNSGK